MRGVLAFLAMLVGCRSRDCADVVARGMASPRGGMIRSDMGTVARMARERGARWGGIDVLVLSGGGSRGAWGAGVLKGWRGAANGGPKFHVVTGVSTGALMATHAFLGTEADDEVLAGIYNGGVTNDQVFRKRLPWAALVSSSLTTFDPLEKTIERVITEGTIDRVAEAGKFGRRLYVATTNLDTGRLKVWNMVEIAQEKKYSFYRAVLLASSSVPVLHEPVELEGFLHVDGGVREQMLLRVIMFGLKAAGAVDSDVRCWVILNGQVGAREVCTQPNLLGVGLRGVEILTAASLAGTLWQTHQICQEVGAEWRLMRVPEDVELTFGSYEFSPSGMKALYSLGVLYGMEEDKWERRVPSESDSSRGIE